MSEFNLTYLNTLDEITVKNWHRDSFMQLADPHNDEISLKNKFFIANREEFRDYLDKAEPKIKKHIKTLRGAFHKSKGKVENYMLSFLILLDEYKNFGLLVTPVDEDGTHILADESEKFHLFTAGTNISFTGPSRAIRDLKLEVHISQEVHLKDEWDRPQKFFQRTPTNSSNPSLKDWLSNHLIDECLGEYQAYAKNEARELQEPLALHEFKVQRMIIYTSLWELKPMISNESYDTLGIFPIVMRSKEPEHKNFFPAKENDFVSFLFVPLETGAGTAEYKIKEGYIFLASGKGYPRTWKQMKGLHRKLDENNMVCNSTKHIELVEFWQT